jgi:hypothetical protein
MRTIYHWDKERQQLVEGPAPRRVQGHAQVWPDIPEYQSPLGDYVVSGRRQRREDLKRNNCIEVGDRPTLGPPVEPGTPGVDRAYAREWYETEIAKRQPCDRPLINPWRRDRARDSR